MFFCGCRPIPVFSYILLLHNQNNKSNVDSAYCWICRVAKKRVKHIRQKWRCHEKKDISFVLSLYLHWLVRALFSARALINPRRTSSLSRVCRSQRMSRGHNQRSRQWETKQQLEFFLTRNRNRKICVCSKQDTRMIQNGTSKSYIILLITQRL